MDEFEDIIKQLRAARSGNGSGVGVLSPDEDYAVRTVIGEAKGEGERGWKWVGGVIKNRATQSGKSIKDTVLAPKQFEPWSSRKAELQGYRTDSPVYQKVAKAIVPILRGQENDPTGGATHFYSPSGQAQLGRSAPEWDNGKGIDVGNHRFFRLGYSGKGKHGITNEFDTVMSNLRQFRSASETDDADTIIAQLRGAQQTPVVQPTPTNPTGAKTPLQPYIEPIKPVTEAPDTIKSQMASALDPLSPRSAVLTTDVSQNGLFGNNSGFTAFPVAQGTLWVNTAKARKQGLRTPQDIQLALSKPDGMTKMLGIVENVGDNTSGTAVVTRGQDGRELTSAVVTNPQAAQRQAEVNAKAFPQGETTIESTDTVARDRLNNPAQRDAVMAQATATGKQPVDILLEMAKGDHPTQQTVTQPQVSITKGSKSQKVGRATPKERVDVNITDIPLDEQAVSAQDVNNTAADIIPIPEGYTEQQAIKYVQDKLSAKYGKDFSKFVPLDGYTGNQAVITYGALQDAGVDIKPLTQTRVAEGRVETNAPDLSLSTPKTPYSVEREAEQRLRDEAAQQEPSMFDTTTWQLGLEKILNDPSMLVPGATLLSKDVPRITPDEYKKAVDDSVTAMIRNAGSATEVEALRKEYADMSLGEKTLRHQWDIASAILRFPASFAKTAAWFEDASDYLKPYVPNITPTDTINATSWLYGKLTGQESKAFKPGEIPMAIATAVENAIPDDPVTRNTFMGKLARATGSAVPFMLGAMATGGSNLTTALLGIGAQVGEGYQQAKDAKLSREKQLLAGLINAPIGASEVLGLRYAKLGELIEQGSKGVFIRSFMSWLKETGKEATEEALQEYFQNAASSVTIDALKKNGITRKDVAKALGGSLEDGFTAAIVGAIFGGGIPAAIKAKEAWNAPATKADTSALLKADGGIGKAATKTETPVTENIPIVGTDVKKKIVNVKTAAKPEAAPEASTPETPAPQAPAKADVSDIENNPADEAWINKILGTEPPKTETAKSEKLQQVETPVETPSVSKGEIQKLPTQETQKVEQPAVTEQPNKPSATRLKDLGYTLPYQQTLTKEQKAEILDKGIPQQAWIDTSKPTAKGDAFNPLAMQKNIADGTKVSWTNPQGLKSQGIVKNGKVEPVSGGTAIPIEKFAEKGITLRTRGGKGLAMVAKSPTGQDLIEALKKPVTREQVQEAKSKITQYGTAMDLTIAVIANRLAKDAGVMTVNFDGAFFEPDSTQRFIANVRKLAKATESKSLEKFANAVEHQFNKEGVAVVYMSPEAGRHEAIHKADYVGAINKAYDGKDGRYNGASEKLKTSAPFQQFHRELVALQNNLTDAQLDAIEDMNTYIPHGVAMAEALAYLGDGKGAEFGLTEGESVSILATLVEGYVTKNGVKALDNFKGDGLIYEIIDEARGEGKRSEGRNASGSELDSKREAGQEVTPSESQKDAGRKSESTGEEIEGKLKPRRTIDSARLAGVTLQPNGYYQTKSVEGNKREAQNKIEEIGLTNATVQAAQPMVDTDETSLRRHTTFQMETAQLLFAKQLEAMADDNKVLADTYKQQKEQIIAATAEQATDTAQALRQLAEWRIFNPETVDVFLNLRRYRKGLPPLTTEESKEVVGEVEKYRNLEQTIADLEQKLADIEAGKKSYSIKGRKTRPLIKAEKKVLDTLSPLRDAAIAALRSPTGLAMAVYDPNRPALDPMTLDKLTTIGAVKLLEGWHEKPISGEQFDKYLDSIFGTKYQEHYEAIRAQSMAKMDTMVKDARQQAKIASVRNRTGNETKADAEIRQIIDTEKAAQKVKETIRAEHRKLAKRFQADEQFIKKAREINPNVSNVVLTGATARASSAHSESEVNKILRQTYPDKFVPSASDTRQQKNDKLHDLNVAVAQSEQLYRQTNKGLSEDRMAARNANKGITAEIQRELETAKRERTEQYKTLTAKVSELEKTKPGFLHTVALVNRMAKVTLLRTAITNLFSTGAERKLVYSPIDAIDIGLQRYTNLKSEGLTKDASIKTALWTPKGKETIVDALGNDIVTSMSKDEILMRLIDEYPEFYSKFRGDFSPDFHSGVSKALDKLMIPMRWQEFTMRDMEAVNALAQRMTQKGLDLNEIMFNKDYTAITPSDMEYALNRALDVTYANKPKYGRSYTDNVFATVNSLIKHSGLTDLLGSEAAPFTNFMFNTINKYKTKIPVLAQARLLGKTYSMSRKLKAQGEENFWQQAFRENWTSTQVAHQIWGYIALGIITGIVRNLGDRDEWYNIRIPGTQGLWNPGESLYLDVRTQPQLAPFFFVANKLNRVLNGKDMFTYGNDSPSGVKAILEELGEAFLGTSYRQSIEENNALNTAWYGLQSPKQFAKWVIGQGDKETDPDRKGELAAMYLSKMLGASLGTATNFLQFQTFKDIVAQFDKEEQYPLDLADRPFIEQLDRKLPESKRILLQFISALPQYNKATGEKKRSNQLPILKVLGFTLKDGSMIKAEPSQAEILAAKARYKDSEYQAPRLADEKFKAAVKRDFRQAGEKLTDGSVEAKALSQKLKTFDSALSKGEMSYAQRTLFTTSLQDNVKALGVKNPALRQIWESATPREQDDIREVIFDKNAIKTKSTDEVIEMIDLNGKMLGIVSPEAMKLLTTRLQEAADNADKRHTLTPDERRRVQKVLPNYK